MAAAKKKKAGKSAKPDFKWIALIFLTTVLISALMSFVSSNLLEGAGLALSFVILICIVLTGILFDIIGVAVTAADEVPFHAMASRKVPEAEDALRLIRNAGKVSSFCNDVIGDICGVISGTASASIVLLILSGKGSLTTGDRLLEIGMAALVSGLTVGGKAIGKTFAMTKSTTIVHWASLVIYYIKSAPGKLKKLLSKRKN